ncbi:MAG: DUF5343 domain-containing protein [Steroidobacteraceae bacterium]
MNPDVPYMLSVANLHKILDAIQKASAPEVFHRDFLKDLGFSSSNDRAAVSLLKYLGFLDPSGRPQSSYRDFMDHNNAKKILAARMRAAYDDLFTSDRTANTKTVEQLKGWFKTKTGAGDAVAQKIATTFKSLATYADFTGQPEVSADKEKEKDTKTADAPIDRQPPESFARGDSHKGAPPKAAAGAAGFGLVYRFEIHLPDTQNVDTYRAIFRALREELM